MPANWKSTGLQKRNPPDVIPAGIVRQTTGNAENHSEKHTMHGESVFIEYNKCKFPAGEQENNHKSDDKKDKRSIVHEFTVSNREDTKVD
ncbi:MAG: hypothetical protein STSR0009_00390 [Methanoregula sp.]